MNLETLGEYLDHYVISARIKPAFFVVLPLSMTAVVWLPVAQELGGAILTFLLTFGAIGFFSNLISNRGNELQNRLFAEWGGAPTTILLRFSDSQLDPYTKARYHRRFEAMIPGLTMPSKEQEQANIKDADACYASAVGFMREHTRDRKKYSMVYTDNVAYGYSRNLLVMKRWGIACAVIALGLNVVLLYPLFSSYLQIEPANLFSMQLLFGLAATGVSFVMLCVFMFAINSKYVKGRAVRYALSLMAACDSNG